MVDFWELNVEFHQSERAFGWQRAHCAARMRTPNFCEKREREIEKREREIEKRKREREKEREKERGNGRA